MRGCMRFSDLDDYPSATAFAADRIYACFGNEIVLFAPDNQRHTDRDGMLAFWQALNPTELPLDKLVLEDLVPGDSEHGVQGLMWDYHEAYHPARRRAGRGRRGQRPEP